MTRSKVRNRSITSASQNDLHDSFGELYQSLTNAYWVASTIVDKDRIRGAADQVFDILTDLNRADLKSRTEDFAELKGQVAIATKKLTALQADIDSIIHNVGVATQVVGAIAKALTASTTFFG